MLVMTMVSLWVLWQNVAVWTRPLLQTYSL
jgi:hypothetical protein